MGILAHCHHYEKETEQKHEKANTTLYTPAL